MLRYIVNDLINVLRYLPYGIVAGILMGLIMYAVNSRRVHRGKKAIPVAAVTSFVMYLAVLLAITYFSREGSAVKTLDLKLFSTWGINNRNNAYVVENVLLFVPFGFTLAWAVKGARKFFPHLFLCFGVSLTVEFLQLVTGRGVFQIDDILTNVVGGFAGYVLFRCVLSEEKTGRRRVRLVYLILAALLIVAAILGVFAFSSDSPQQSFDLSVSVSRFLVDKADRWLGIWLDPQEKEIVLRFANPVVRKLAHASEYGALAVILGFCMQLLKKNRAKVVNCLYAVTGCFLIAMTDECLQMFVFDRVGRMADVLVDLCGAIAGACLYLFLSELIEFLAGKD